MFGYVGLLENILFDIKMVKGQMDLVRFDFCFFFLYKLKTKLEKKYKGN